MQRTEKAVARLMGAEITELLKTFRVIVLIELVVALQYRPSVPLEFSTPSFPL